MPLSQKRKEEYFEKFKGYLDAYSKCFIVEVDNVGSKQLQDTRRELRGKADVLMGKNTLMRKVVNAFIEEHPGHGIAELLPHLVGNCGLIFVKKDLDKVREIVKRRCDMGGLNPQEFSAHSLRSGFLTEAGRRGVSLKAAMNLSGHSSVVTALGYMREGEVGTEPVARLLDDDPA